MFGWHEGHMHGMHCVMGFHADGKDMVGLFMPTSSKPVEQKARVQTALHVLARAQQAKKTRSTYYLLGLCTDRVLHWHKIGGMSASTACSSKTWRSYTFGL